MKLTYIISVGLLLCSAVIMILFYSKQKKPVKAILFGSLSGLLSLLAAKWIFSATGLTLSLNLFTLCCSLVLGIPGTITACILQLW